MTQETETQDALEEPMLEQQFNNLILELSQDTQDEHFN